MRLLPKHLSTSVFLCSLSVLAFEISLVRIFAVVQWQNLSSLIISIALCGFGASGTFLFFCSSLIDRQFQRVFLFSQLAYFISLFAGFITITLIPLNPFELGVAPEQLYYLLAALLAMAVPFFFAANVIGLALIKGAVGRTYFINLLGSAFGALSVIVLLYFVHPANLIVPVFLVAATAIFLFASNFSPKNARILRFSVAALSCLFLFVHFALVSFEISEYKTLARVRLMPESRTWETRVSPLAVLDSVSAKGLRNVGDLSMANRHEIPEQKALIFDGESMSMVTPYDGCNEALAFLRYTPASLGMDVFGTGKDRAILILGAGGGEGILRSKLYEFSEIHAVELDANVIQAMTNEFHDYSGGIYSDPSVQIFNKEIRGYLSSTKHRYDMIELAMADSFGSAAAAVYALNESYLYTVEAFSLMLQTLKDDGILSVTRWNVTPPRDNIKLMNIAAEALKAQGVLSLSEHVIMIRSMRTSTMLISPRPFPRDAIERARHFASSRMFDMVHFDGMTEASANRFVLLEDPLYYYAAQSIFVSQDNAFTKDYPFAVHAAQDTSPYFYNHVGFKTIPFLVEAGVQKIPVTEWGFFILLLLLIPVAVLSFLAIILPLLVSQHRQDIPALSNVAYFAAIGIGFFFIEIPLIQKFILFLHHPAYSLSVIIAALLLFSGIGSYFSDYVFQQKTRVLKAVSVIIALLVFYALFLDNILQTLQFLGDVPKIILTVIFLAPAGFFMGFPFPQGLTKIRNSGSAATAWAWGINGFFSVISVLLANILAIQFSFTLVLAIAALMYLLAGLLSLN